MAWRMCLIGDAVLARRVVNRHTSPTGEARGVTIIPAEVAAHDRRIADIDADLDRYVADEYVRLAFDLREIRFPGGEDSQAPQRDRSPAPAPSP